MANDLVLSATPTRDVALVIFLLFLSGNPVVGASGIAEAIFASSALFLGVLLIAIRRNFRWSHFLAIAVPLLAVMAVQAVDFEFLPVVTILGVLTKLFIGASVVWLVEDFPFAFVRAMVLLSSFALAIYGIDQLAIAGGLDFRGLFAPLERLAGASADHRFVLVHSFMVDGAHRNAGFFREPGLFAGYLLLAILFLLLRERHFRRRTFLAYLAILTIALLSTFSTAGYVTLPFVLAVFAVLGVKPRTSGQGMRSSYARTSAVVAIFAIGGAGAWTFLTEAEFVSDKIIAQLDLFNSQERGFEVTRFGGAYFDMQAIKERPVTGWGVHGQTKYALTPELEELAVSGGVTGWWRSFGAIGLLALLISYWKCAYSLTWSRPALATYVTLLFLIIAQPNTFLMFSFFQGLMFVRCNRSAMSRTNV